MIIKSKPRKNASFRQLLDYLLDDKGRGKEHDRFFLTHNVRGDTVDEWVHSFMENQTKHGKVRKNGTKVLHEIISFHIKDAQRIDMHKLQDIAREYIKLRGIRGMYVAIPHVEDDHQHIHVCGSPWEFGGKQSMRLSREEFKQLKIAMQEYQERQFPELAHSVVNHNKQSPVRDVDIAPHQTKLDEVIARVYAALRTTDTTEKLVSSLEHHGLSVYYRSTKPAGVLFEGRKYRFKRLGLSWEALNRPKKAGQVLHRKASLRKSNSREQRRNLNQER